MPEADNAMCLPQGLAPLASPAPDGGGNNKKRPLPSVSPSASDVAEPSVCGSVGGGRKGSKRRKTVSFRPVVDVREYSYAPGAAGSPSPPAWMAREELDNCRARARALVRLHRLRSRSSSPQGAQAVPRSPFDVAPAKPPTQQAIRAAVRLEVEGESLRGMEHASDSSIGRGRRQTSRAAVGTVLALGPIVGRDELAREYELRSRPARDYARAVAREDAAVVGRDPTPVPAPENKLREEESKPKPQAPPRPAPLPTAEPAQCAIQEFDQALHRAWLLAIAAGCAAA